MASAIMADAAELTPKENTIVDIGAWTARGEQDKLGAAFKAGFDAGLTLNEAKELVGQLYAYCGFPRALNAAATLMKIEGYGLTRRRGEAESAENENGGKIRNGGSFVLGDKALEIGTANQTKLCGGPVKGALFDFHPQLDEYLKTHLFGDIFARDILDWRTREIVTIAALAARPETEPQMKAHIAIGKVNGVTDAQAAEIVRRVQLPRYPSDLPSDWSPIPVGEPNTAYAKYFIGNSYLHKLTLDQVPAFGVTFEPGCRNNWHVHHKGVQVIVCVAGRGWYQEEGKEPVELVPGKTIAIPAEVKHWHGAAKDSWMQHLTYMTKTEDGASNEWLEPVTDEVYGKLP